MTCIKIGLRNNLLYPSLFILFTALRKIIKLILDSQIKTKLSFLMILFMVLIELILGVIFSWKNNNNIKSNNNEKQLINKKDNSCKILFLVFCSAYFELIGFLSRRLITIYDSDNDDYDEFNAKFRSMEVCVSSLLIFFTLKAQIYRHQIFSLIIIIFCLTLISVIEFIKRLDNKFDYLLNILEVIGTSICRAFLDTTEKYLFNIDFINIFKLIRLQSFINLILMSLLYCFKMPRQEVEDLFCLKWDKILLGIGLLLVYAILSGFKNIYRRYTVQEYSPMTRALAESILDPIFLFIGFFEDIENNLLYYFLPSLICTIIIVLCGCVYNDFIVLYFCGLEKETYLEITKRGNEDKLIQIIERN